MAAPMAADFTSASHRSSGMLTRYLGIYLVYLATVVRTATRYEGRSEQGLVISLLAIYGLLLVLEPRLTRAQGWRPWVYLLLQSALVIGLQRIPPHLELLSTLFVPLSLQAVLFFGRRTGLVWMAAFTLAIADPVIAEMKSTFPGVAMVLLYGAVFFLMGHFADLIRREEVARRENQRLIGELRMAHRRLQDYAAQMEGFAAAQERGRLARELHDSATQTIFGMNLTVQTARMLVERDPGRVAEQLDRLQALARSAVAEIQALASQLRPRGPVDEGLLAALRRLIAEREARDGLRVRLEVAGERDLPEPITAGLCRITQEALNNVAKHAGTRDVAVLLLIPFHTARLFDMFESFYVKNSETSFALSAFVGFLGSWHMPLLFLLAGAATWFALGFRSPAGYVGERFKRLVIPLIFGVLVVVPPQMYFAQRFHSQYAGSYLDFYPGFFQFVAGSDYPGIGFSFAHLWFILFLFPMALIALPLFVFLRRKLGARLTAGIAGVLARPGAILLLALPLPFTTLADDPTGHNFTLYIILFAYGYLLMSDVRFQEALYRVRWIASALGVVATAGYFAAVLIWGTTGEDVSLASVLFQMAYGFSGWFWIVAFLGFGQRYLNAKNALLRYANDAAYPFYILHQTAIVVIGYYVVQWQADALLKFVVIAVFSLAASLGVYDLVIRRLDLTRFLFGMKPKVRVPVAEVVSLTDKSAA